MNRYFFGSVAALWLVMAATSATQAPPQPSAASPVSSAAPADVVKQYCYGCHSQRVKAGGLVLETVDVSKPAAHGEILEKVAMKLRAGMMPPAGSPRPSPEVRNALVNYFESSLDAAAVAAPNPGRPALHRLNRAEYANAIRDLLALDIDPAVLLPPDDSSDGFDNNADVLGVSPALLERYLAAARKIGALALGDPQAGPSTDVYRAPPDMSQSQHREGLPLGTQGGLVAKHTFPSDGEYVIKVKLQETTLGQIRGLEYVNQVEVLLDGERIHIADIGGPEDYVGSADNATDVLNNIGARLTVRVPVTAGPHVIAAAFIGRSAVQGGQRLQYFRRTNVDTTDHTGFAHVEYLSIAGPFKATGTARTPSRDRILICRPATPAQEPTCARQIVETLARRAYRRPVSATEVNRLMAFYEAGRKDGSFDRGIERALRSILASPKFVFRAEQDAQAPAGTVYAISDLELASRLSFFLWSSIPDDQLIDVARRGTLRQPVVFERQVRRMLADRRSDALVANFAGQWLQLRNLRSSIPDQNDFPDFDDNLRQAFRRETELFFQSIVSEDRSALDLLRADYTFVNERLAKHYGIPNVYGSRFRRVSLGENNVRGGLLGQGSILTVTSYANRTSPVLRGKWILENIVGTPPPPPPANVPLLQDTDANGRVLSMRERMVQHRSRPECASCHRLMDPAGLSMENFDAIGRWRTRTESGSEVDASGGLPDGSEFTGASGLRSALLRRPDLFVGTLTEKLMTYGLGRGLEFHDAPAVRTVVRNAQAQDYRFSSLVLGIVRSDPFLMRMSQ